MSATVAETVTVELTPDDPSEIDVIAASDGGGPSALTVEFDVMVGDDEADPDAGFRVAVERPDGTEMIDDTDEHGEASFPGIYPGTYTIKRVGTPVDPDVHEPMSSVAVPSQGRVNAKYGDRVQNTCRRVVRHLSEAWADDICRLTDAELAFCLRHIRYCYFFFNDQKEAYKQAENLFDWARDDADATKANALQHSYWTARMVRTMRKVTPFSNPTHLAIDFATRHESVERKGDARARRRSAMDRHNNGVGYRYALRFAEKHNNTFLCNGMRRKVKTASGGGPRVYSKSRLYWIERRDRVGHYVHLLNRRC